MKKYALQLSLLFALLGFSAVDVAAQATRFEGRTSMRKVIAGETFELTFTLYNAEKGRFSPPDLDKWKVLEGPNQGQGSQTVYVNGRMNHQRWTEYSYVLRAPENPGKYTIAPAQMSVNGQNLATKPLEIEVVRPASPNPNAKREQDISLGNQVVLVAEPLTQNTLAGELVPVDFRLYYRVPLQEYDVVSLPDILNANVVEVEKFDPSLEDRMLNGLSYSTQVLRRLAVYPLSDGTLDIGPMLVRVHVPISDPWSIFFSQVMPYELESAPVRIRILPPPAPPTDANGGGVGDYRVYAAVDRTELSTDDALQLSLTVEGKGDLRTVNPPLLDLPAESFEVFEPTIEDGPSTYENGSPTGWKRFVWTILPRTAADPARIPVDFTWLDTRSRSYRRLDTVLQVRIVPGNRKSDATADLDYAHQDIRPYRAGGVLTADRTPFFSSWAYKCLWSLPFLLVLAALTRRFLPKKFLEIPAVRKADAPRENGAREHLPQDPLLLRAFEAKKAANAQEFYRALYEWTLSAGDGEKSVSDLRRHCERVLYAGVPPDDLEKVWKKVPTGR